MWPVESRPFSPKHEALESPSGPSLYLSKIRIKVLEIISPREMELYKKGGEPSA